MADIIQLLPDNIANQIAAGEVIQRPASAVKELLENAADAGATHIQLIVSDAGKSLIQVTDNGKGMSETDARLSFERHATSKIRQIEDLFKIVTMGFRGEALASIAAVAQVELRTRKSSDELGTYIEIENSVVLKQEPCACPEGTNICMKNLFFNVPARRNFLKSNAAEMRHIVDEFIRVAMAFPAIFFSFTNNGQQLFYLETGNYKQRIVQLLGSQYNTRLVNVNEQTDYLNIYGFVGKPDAARKTRGEQYLFVNNRFIRSAYLNHAVTGAFADLIAKDSFPLYVLFINLDPAQIDINVHPTKQEIKFEDEKIVYAFVQSAVKHALAQFSIAPSLDFSLDADIQQLEAVSKPFTEERKQIASSTDLYKTFTKQHQAHVIEPSAKSELKHWKEYFTAAKEEVFVPKNNQYSTFNTQQPVQTPKPVVQLHNTYIVAVAEKGFILIHQQLAHERIMYEQLSKAMQGKPMSTQQSLFPATLQLTAADAILLEDVLPDLQLLGYVIEPFGKDVFVIQGTPADVLQGNEAHVIELLLEQLKHFTSDIKFSKREKLVRCMARQQAIKAGKSLSETEMETITKLLFACDTPNLTPGGSPAYIAFTEEYLDKLFVR